LSLRLGKRAIIGLIRGGGVKGGRGQGKSENKVPSSWNALAENRSTGKVYRKKRGPGFFEGGEVDQKPHWELVKRTVAKLDDNTQKQKELRTRWQGGDGESIFPEKEL